MKDQDDDYKDWIDIICESNQICPISGYWKLLQTNEDFWIEKGDRFTQLESEPYERTTYRYLGKKK